MHIIAGMHRSGTSFLSQALSQLGADFGDPSLFISADFWNQNGYFESIDVVDTNNKLILGNGVKLEYWLDTSVNRVTRFVDTIKSRKWKYFLCPSQKAIQKNAKKCNGELQRVHEVYRDAYVKDPRFCLTYDIWKKSGPIGDVVFSFRDPSSVARSIQRREGLPLAFGFRYWLYHVQTFFRHLPEDQKVLLVNFDDFFDPKTQDQAFERLRLYRGVASNDEGFIKLARTLDIRLRTQELDAAGIPKYAKHAYEALLELYAQNEGQIIIPKGSQVQNALAGENK